MTEVPTKEDGEFPVPSSWRGVFHDVVEALRKADFNLCSAPECVERLTYADAELISRNIQSYGDSLVELPKETWKSSIYRWMDDKWVVLIDLFTKDEGSSDLVMFANVYESPHGYRFEIESVHVP
jgi:hypothetical protein